MADNSLSPDEESKVDYMTEENGAGVPPGAASFDVSAARRDFVGGTGTPTPEGDNKRKEIDMVEYYMPAINAGPQSEAGKRMYEKLDTNDEVNDTLRELGIADDVANAAARDYKFNHPGEEVKTEGARFGIQTIRVESREGGSPNTWNQLTMYATHPGTGERVRWIRRFADTSELLSLTTIPQGTPRAQETQQRLTSLVNQQPILVQKG